MKIKRIGVAAIALAAAGALVLTGCAAGIEPSAPTGDPSADHHDQRLRAAEPADPDQHERDRRRQDPRRRSSPDWSTTTPRVLRTTMWPSRSRPTTSRTTRSRSRPARSSPTASPSRRSLRRRLELRRAVHQRSSCSSYFFDDIEGFSYRPRTPSSPASRSSTTPTFTVELDRARGRLRRCVSATRRSTRCPSRHSTDIEAFGREPDRQRPVHARQPKSAWKHNVKIDLVTNPDYNGAARPQNGGLTIIFYATPGRGIRRPARPATSTCSTQFRDARSRPTRPTSATVRSTSRPRSSSRFTIPDASSTSAAKRASCVAQALSMAINRHEITDVDLPGHPHPGLGLHLAGHRRLVGQLQGADVLEFNAEEGEGPVGRRPTRSPRGAARSDRLQRRRRPPGLGRRCRNSIKNTLGIDASGKPYPTFAERSHDRHEPHDRPARSAPAGRPTTPVVYNFLAAAVPHRCRLERRGLLDNPEFDTLLKEGAAAETDRRRERASTSRLRRSCSRTSRPSRCGTPTSPAATADTVDNVVFGWDSVPLYYEITKSSSRPSWSDGRRRHDVAVRGPPRTLLT